jgi:membrane associated rhomboid family serine protease
MPLSPRLKWKINRYRREVDDRIDRLRTLMLSVWSRQRMCPACRALIDRKETVCPLCGERLTRGTGGAFNRIVSAVIPDQMRYTVYILSVNVFLFLITMAASMKRMEGERSLGAMLNIDGATLVRFGAQYGLLISSGEWWRFITPIFLHGGLLHLGMNSWVLFDLGPTVEGLYGRQKFFVLYMLSGIAGTLLSYWWNPGGLSIGASGAIVGLIGAMITYGYRNRSRFGDAVRNMFVRWAIYVLAFGFLFPAVDNAAHIGGLLAGMTFGWMVSDMPSLTSGSIYFWKTLQALLTLLIIVSFIMVGLRANA